MDANIDIVSCVFSFSPVSKGQLISKENFGVFNSSKNERENHNFGPSLLGQTILVRFFEELKTYF